MQSKKSIISIILLALAFIFCLNGLNKTHISPIYSTINLDSVTSYASTDKGTVLISDQREKLFFLNEQQELKNIVDMNNFGSPFDKVSKVIIENDIVYVLGSNHFNKGIYISNERIVSYDLDGNFIEKIYETSYAQNDYITSQNINDFNNIGINKEGIVKTTNFNDVDTATIKISPLFRLENAIFYISIIYIIAFLLILLVNSIIKKKVSQNSLIILGIIILVIITCIFYSITNFKESKAANEKIIRAESYIITADISDYLKNNEDEIRNVGVKDFYKNTSHTKELEELQTKVSYICNSFADDTSIYVKVFVFNSDGNSYPIIDSQEKINYENYGTITTDDWKKITNNKFDTVTKFSTNYSTNYVIYRKIDDVTGNPLGIVLTGFYADNLIKVQTNKCIEMAVNLSSIMIVLYLCLSLSLTFYNNFKRRSSRSKDNVYDRSADIAGLYSFLQMTVSKVDGVIIVFVSQYLCRNMDTATSIAMAAIPITVCSAGQWIGTFIATPISKIIGERKTGYLSTLISTLTLLLIVFSIISDSFILFVIGKFLFGMFIKGVTYVIGDTIPFGASSEEIKVTSVNSTRSAGTAASIFTTLLAGYISQYLSYATTYFMAAVIMIILFLLVPLFFPKRNVDNSSIKKEKSTIKVDLGWSMWLTPSMIIFVLMLMIPRSVMLAYESYIFPLYTAAAGISTILISNLSVYSKTLSLLLSDNINEFIRKFNRSKVLVFTQICIAIAYILFIINGNIYWAIVTLFIEVICDKTSQNVASLHVSDIAIEKGYDEKQEVSNYYSVNSATYILQTPVVSAFLTFGYNIGCAAIGAVCGVCISLFALFNYKSRSQKRS